MRAQLTMRLAAAALVSATAAGASAQVILTDPAATYVASALTGFATTGGDMGGMLVTAYFTDGSSAFGNWGDLGTGAWGVSLPSFSLTVAGAGDTYDTPWVLLGGPAGGPLSLTRLVLKGAPGKTVFDIIPDPWLTDGSAQGKPMAIVGGDVFGTVATYRNRVGISPAAPLRDLFETLDITFQTPIGPNGAQFIADTDNIARGGTITQTPEPATYTMLAAGIGGLFLVHQRRRRTA